MAALATTKHAKLNGNACFFFFLRGYLLFQKYVILCLRMLERIAPEKGEKMNYARLLADMRIAANAASELVLDLQGGSEKVEKKRRDFVTNADFASDTLIRSWLGSRYPDVPFYTEESGGEPATKGLLWVVDAIDGTTNYYYKDDGNYWGISIALVRDGKTVAAVVARPGAGQVFYADTEDHACVSPGGALAVSDEGDLASSRVWCDWVKGDPEIVYDVMRKLNDNTVLPQLRCCATISAMQVAMGYVDGYVIPRPQPFDIAAAGLIVEQAGGRVTDIAGRPWTPFSTSFVATNGKIHRRLIEVLNP